MVQLHAEPLPSLSQTIAVSLACDLLLRGCILSPATCFQLMQLGARFCLSRLLRAAETVALSAFEDALEQDAAGYLTLEHYQLQSLLGSNDLQVCFANGIIIGFKHTEAQKHPP